MDKRHTKDRGKRMIEDLLTKGGTDDSLPLFAIDRYRTLKLLFFTAVILFTVLSSFMCTERKGPEKVWPSIKTDPESIQRGERLFDTDCRYCHDPFSTRMETGPGLLGILKKPSLPSSRRPATPQNISKQLTEPYDKMPSFRHLTEQEQEELLAFLNTL